MPTTSLPPRDRGILDAAVQDRLHRLEQANLPVIVIAAEYPDGYSVARHRHRRAQLLHVPRGTVMVATDFGRWLVPAGHAIWLPAGVDHAVEMSGAVRMQSVYVAPERHAERLSGIRVTSMTALASSLIESALEAPDAAARRDLVEALLVDEIARLPERPLVLPMPRDAKLSALCRRFMAAPSPHLAIDDWAREAGMSRRSFTRQFQRETGFSLAAWRQQALVLSALPSLADGASVTQVAFDLGYESVAAFITMFRRVLGQTPRSFARQGRHA